MSRRDGAERAQDVVEVSGSLPSGRKCVSYRPLPVPQSPGYGHGSVGPLSSAVASAGSYVDGKTKW